MDQQATEEAATASADGGGSPPGDAGFLAGGGEMGALMRAHDWARTPLGPPEGWPQGLRLALRIMLTSRYAMWMAWGPELTFFCNDAYRPTLGVKQAWALGSPAREVWAEIWRDIGPRIERVMATGTATYDEGLLLFLERSGYPEETYHTFSYSPLPGDAGGVAGMLCVVTEETERVIGERRLACLRDLASGLAATNAREEVLAAIGRGLGANDRDLPFALTYLFEGDGTGRARLAGATGGLAAGDPAAPPLVEAGDDAGAGSWPVGELLARGAPVAVGDLGARFASLPGGAWDRPPSQAVMVPIARQGHERPAGVLIAGLNPYRPFDAAYAGFVDLVAGQIAAGLANASAYEAERRRAEALAEIDRAKTTFFSNISHELRTPLTLMLGPIEELLARPSLAAAEREPLEAAHRNSLRLLKLVNTLLDFSRIEAGRARARYEPVDLSALTADLASGFRAAVERAGLALEVDCPPLPAPVHVDRDMWEKVVLNLLSNAFKHTFEGRIAVRVRPAQGGAAAELAVRDTGVGIPAHELPRLFERFHRVEGQRSRSHEGSGIGLALVHELVRLHGGSIEVRSEVRHGSEFVVTVPLGTAHLPAGQVGEGAAPAPTAVAAGVYADEASRWLPDDDDDAAAPSAPEGEARPRLLLADDNADMRGYVRRLLAGRYEVEAVADGAAALASLRRRRPDLLLSDVMMPGLDGLGLLREVRADPALRDLPVIMLSARAGEEARVEGLDAGADDYLTKPFSARELAARVAANLAAARIRREAAEAVLEREEQLRLIVESAKEYAIVTLDPEGRITSWNAGAERLLGHAREEALGRPGEIFFTPEDVAAGEPGGETRLAREEGRAANERWHVRKDGSRFWGSGVVLPLADGRRRGYLKIFRDRTEERRAEEGLREGEERLRLAQEAGGVGLWDWDLKTGRRYRSPILLTMLGVEPGQVDPDADGLGLVHPEDRAATRAALEAAIAETAPLDRELRVLRPDGTVRWFALRGRLVTDQDGAPWRLAGVCLDITERKRAEEALREREAELARVQRIGGVGGVEVDLRDALRDGFRNRRSPEYLRLHGLPPEAADEPHEAWVRRVHPDDRERAEARFKDAVAGGACEYAAEYRIVRPDDGRVRWISAKAEIERDADGRPLRLIGAHIDVTALKEAEAALRESEARFRAMADGAPALIYVIDAGGQVTFANRHYEELFGRPADDILGDGWRRVVHPDDVDGFHAAFLAAFGERRRFEAEVRVTDRGGAVRWLRCEAVPRFDGAGAFVGYVGCNVDVTGAKRAEAALRLSERRFRAAVDAVSGILWTNNAEGRMEGEQPGWAALTGQSRAEYQGYGWAGAVHPEDAGPTVDAWNEAVAERATFAFEHRVRRRDGEWRLFSIRAIPVLGPEGDVREWVGVHTDVTERKRAQEQRELLLHELSHRVKNILAVVQAIASQTGARSAGVRDFLDAFRGRMRALSVAHELLTAEGWRGADLPALAGSALGPYAGDGRVRLGLPSASLDPATAQTLSLALHELATNAAKHGALSAPGGRVTLDGALDGRLAITWREEGGPPVAEAPADRGFGTTLLTRAIAHQHRGRVELDWRREGLVCRIELPLGRP